MADPTTALQNAWENPITGLGTSGMSFAITVVLTVIFTISILYMLAYAFRNERFKRWLTGELMQAFASVMMILGLVAIAIFISDVSVQLVTAGNTELFYPDSSWGADFNAQLSQSLADAGVSTGPVTGPVDYLRGKLRVIDAQLDAMYGDAVDTNMQVERAEWTCFIFAGVEVKCGWDLHPKVEMLHAIAYKLVQLRVAVNAEIVLVDYIWANFLPILLPIGIVLRAFPFTRGAGGLIIATVLGFYFVFPLLFTLSDLSLSTQLTRTDTSFLSSAFSACVFGDYSMAAQLNAADLAAVNAADGVALQLTENLAAIILEVILAPLLILAATVLFIRAISPMLGSESQDVVYGISKLL